MHLKRISGQVRGRSGFHISDAIIRFHQRDARRNGGHLHGKIRDRINPSADFHGNAGAIIWREKRSTESGMKIHGRTQERR